MGEMVLLVFVSSLLMASMNIDFVRASNDGGVINVGGKVLCQDCTQGYNEWKNGAKPIKGSRVSITCFERSRVVYYGSDETDKTGAYEITLNKYINGKKLNPRDCFLRLVSSPDPVCNIATNSGGGRLGVRLDRPPTTMYRDTTKYMLGSFYYTTPMCDEPDTTSPEY